MLIHTAQGDPIRFNFPTLDQFVSLEPVGGSAPKFSSGAIEQLKIEASTATALLCAAQAAPSPSFRSTGHLFVQSFSDCHPCVLVLLLGRLLPLVYLHKSPQLEQSLPEKHNPAMALAIKAGIKFLGSESSRAGVVLLHKKF